MSEKQLVEIGAGKPAEYRRLPNTIVFPKTLREAIPEHSDRVLEFDRVSAATQRSWIDFSHGWLKAQGYDLSIPRAQLSLLAHETGNLTGQYEIGLDLDVKTLRALGEFFLQLAERAEAERG
jgi:hypothetical protein